MPWFMGSSGVTEIGITQETCIAAGVITFKGCETTPE